ncbi:MAG: hypothetical protein ACTSU5_06780 [Promethearchaeota archaeon]
MKLRLCLAMDSKTGKEVVLKLNIPPSKKIGFSNFVNAAFSKNRTVSLYFEKKEADKPAEKSTLVGHFKFVEEKPQKGKK